VFQLPAPPAGVVGSIIEIERAEHVWSGANWL
jgi:hypothetical protein